MINKLTYFFKSVSVMLGAISAILFAFSFFFSGIAKIVYSFKKKNRGY